MHPSNPCHENHFLATETGKRPVERFLDSLDSKEAQKISWVLKLIEELDRIPYQYSRSDRNRGDMGVSG